MYFIIYITVTEYISVANCISVASVFQLPGVFQYGPLNVDLMRWKYQLHKSCKVSELCCAECPTKLLFVVMISFYSSSLPLGFCVLFFP